MSTEPFDRSGSKREANMGSVAERGPSKVEPATADPVQATGRTDGQVDHAQWNPLGADSVAPEVQAPLRHRADDAAEWVGASLEAVLRARAPGMHASTPLVCQLSARVGRELGFDAGALKLLVLGARVRDIGMIALPDSVVLATAARSPAEWELVNSHPAIGQRMLERLVVVASAAPIVRSHHERWDGAGYPDGLREGATPPLSRVIAVCDAFVAVARDRPHRRGMGAEAALELVCHESGAQFDPDAVDALAASLVSDSAPKRRRRATAGAAPGRAGGSDEHRDRLDLANAIAEFDVVPVLAPAYEQVLAATAPDGSARGELLTSVVESDTGLTVAVMRRAQALGKRPIANVGDAVHALGPDGIAKAAEGLPRTEFPWRTSRLDVLMHRSLVHAQAVARAMDRISSGLELAERDDVLAAALLHDIGKLVMGRALPDYTDAGERTSTPEARARDEMRAWGMDHASVGGLLLSRWGLPDQLASAVAAHHSAEAEHDVATYVRLADMVAHHAQGETIDRAKMLGLAQLCGLSPHGLRDILFDLPRAGGSRRRRAEPSPLSDRQTAVLRLLADGKVYKEIAAQLGLASTTVRTHLHNIYGLLAVPDRAQAVLRATDMGWL
jgi:putative nucleotidyltransferase with HDIG domain